jgi:hypothetical protein
MKAHFISILLFIMASASIAMAQNKATTKPFIQTLHLETTLVIKSFTLNYQIHMNKSPVKPYLGTGIQFFVHSKSYKNVFMAYPQLGMVIGNTHAFEANMGVSIDMKYGEHMPTIYAGYRFASRQNAFCLKAGFTAFFLGFSKGETLLQLPALFPAPSLAMGLQW